MLPSGIIISDLHSNIRLKLQFIRKSICYYHSLLFPAKPEEENMRKLKPDPQRQAGCD